MHWMYWPFVAIAISHIPWALSLTNNMQHDLSMMGGNAMLE